MAKVLVFQDERLIQLRAEIQRHPELKKRLETAMAKGEKSVQIIFDLKEGDNIPVVRTFSKMLSFLAAEVGVLVHGTYNGEEMFEICEKIRARLADKRTVIVNKTVEFNCPIADPRNVSKIIH